MRKVFLSITDEFRISTTGPRLILTLLIILSAFSFNGTPHAQAQETQTGTIKGTVKDGSGNPIADAHVHASDANGAPIGFGSPPTGPDGAFFIDGLPPGQYKTEARSEGYKTQYYLDKSDWMFADPITVSDGSQTVIDFKLVKEQGAIVNGQVVLPNGAPIHNGWVSAESPDRMFHKGAGVDENGNFRIFGLSPGTWLVRAYPPDGTTNSEYSESEEVEVFVSDNQAQNSAEIQMGSPIVLLQANVVGQVLMPDGSPAQQGGVAIFNADHSIHKDMGVNFEGFFRAAGLPAGTFFVQLHTPWGVSGIVPPPPSEFVITNPGVITELGTFQYLNAVKHITGVVVREDGSGVPHVEVNANKRGQEGWANMQTDPAGRFLLDVSAGTWDVNIYPNWTANSADWVYFDEPKIVSFEESQLEETKAITFTVKTPSASVTGSILAPDGSVPPHEGIWIDVRDNTGRGNGVQLSPDGTFSVPVVSGTYNVWIGLDERSYAHWASPPIPPISVVDGPSYNLGEIQLVEKTSVIEGVVRQADTGNGIEGVRVNAWQFEGAWATATTDPDGLYRMPVLAGTWEVDVEQQPNSSYVSDQPPHRVVIADNEVKPGINFDLQPMAATVEGTLIDTEGNLLDHLRGWAFVRTGDLPHPIAGVPVENGRFTLNVPSGQLKVGVDLPPNSGYTSAGEQEIGTLAMAATIAEFQTRAEVAVLKMSASEQSVYALDGTVIQLEFTMLENDSHIRGTFFLDDAKTQPATGLMGEVFAMQGDGFGWQAVPIDPVTGEFDLNVAAGTWNLGYWLESDEYITNPPPDTRVTIESGDTFIFNFSVVETDASIEGVIKDPDGNPLVKAGAWAHRGRSETSAEINTGTEAKPPDAHFTLRVLSGGEYEVGGFAPPELGFIQPDIQTVTPVSGSSVNVTLQFKESDSKIVGTVFYHDEAGNSVYGPFAWVWAWSDDGQHTGAPTDGNGHFELNVMSGTTWHVGASYQAVEGSLIYETYTPTDVSVDPNGVESIELHMHLMDTALPPAVANTFDPSVGWIHTLEDGTTIMIPGGAMPTDDTSVRISVTPLVEELPNTLLARPFGFGYAFVAYEDTSGNQIVNTFNANVLITFFYTDEELSKRGVTEDDLSPAYFSTTTNSWTKVESFSVNKESNQLTVQVNHFTTFALTMPATSTNGPYGYTVFVPMVVQK